MTQQERIEEIESMIVPDAPYEAQLLAVDLLTRMIDGKNSCFRK